MRILRYAPLHFWRDVPHRGWHKNGPGYYENGVRKELLEEKEWFMEKCKELAKRSFEGNKK